jgi:hypothetical protein
VTTLSRGRMLVENGELTAEVVDGLGSFLRRYSGQTGG